MLISSTKQRLHLHGVTCSERWQRADNVLVFRDGLRRRVAKEEGWSSVW